MSSENLGQMFIDVGGKFDGYSPTGDDVTIVLRAGKYTSVESVVKHSNGLHDITFLGNMGNPGDTLKNVDVSKMGYFTTYPKDTITEEADEAKIEPAADSFDFPEIDIPR